MQKRKSTEKAVQPMEERLLSAALKVFLAKGSSAASIDEVAVKAKASKLTFYNHYGDKERLFEAVVSRQTSSLVERSVHH